LAIVAGCLLAAPAAAAGDPLASAIQKRLAQAGNLTFPMKPLSDYVESGGVAPESGFYVYAGLHSPQSFRFSVVIYKTAAQAAAAYDAAVEQVHAIGGNFRAFNVVREGRALYMGSTAGAPSPSNPKLPVKAFHAMVALAAGNF
jgi:hypothetical protein